MDQNLEKLAEKKICAIGWDLEKDRFVVKAGVLHKFKEGFILTDLHPELPMDYFEKIDNNWFSILQTKNTNSLEKKSNPYILMTVDPISISIPQFKK